MSISEEDTSAIERLTGELYDELLVGDIPDDAPYKGAIDIETQFALTRQGYQSSYIELIRSVLRSDSIGEVWSEKAIGDKVHELLVSMAKLKAAEVAEPDLSTMTRDWMAALDIQFDEHECFTPVIGLSVEVPVTIGEVTFAPLDAYQDRLSHWLADSFLDGLAPHKDSLAMCAISGEIRKAAEVLNERADYALNVLRLIGSLIWHQEPTRHIYLAGNDRSRTSPVLVLDPQGGTSRMSFPRYPVVPYWIDADFIDYANFYGLDYLQQLISADKINPIERSLLVAVQWFGDALQELVPLSAFVKHYVSIEAALKKPGEHARQVIPKRMSILLEPWIADKQRDLKANLEDLIDERNSVFHEGIPIAEEPEYLAWVGKILSRQVLHQLRLRIKSDQLQDKDGLIAWVDGQFDEYLSEPKG